MLEQVAGRAGRKEEQGEVLIQTFDHNNSVLQLLAAHDYEGLYRQQLAERKLFNYPPFHRIIRIQLRHSKAEQVQKTALALQSRLRQQFGPRVSEAVVPTVERVQAKYIREINLRIENTNRIAEAKRLLSETLAYIVSIPIHKSVKIIIDVDP